MGNWRRQRGRNNYNQQEIMQQQGTRSNSGKPPLDNWKRSVPAWEKHFCTRVGSVPWGKVLEAKRSMYLYDNVVQWNDSAGEEAFNNAKARFWAKINGLPCNISLPDPDVYIDDVDWDAEVNNELIMDLECDPEPRGQTTEDEHVVILDTSLLCGQYTLGWGTGWGDADDMNENVAAEQTGHRDWKTGKPESSWDQNHDEWNNNSWGREKIGSWDRKHNEWNDDSWGRGNIGLWDHTNTNVHCKNAENGNGGDWGRRKRAEGQDVGWRTGGYKLWRVHGEEEVDDCRWRNGRGRNRGSFQHHSNGRLWTESF